MRILIVEDEKMAADRLSKLLQETSHSIEVLAKIDSIKRAVKWLQENEADLLFFDIQLADGLSFEILEQVEVQTPIIFTTAFDEYAVKAFKLNSVDYLLKPIDPKELATAIEKYESLFAQKATQSIDLSSIEQAMMHLTKKYKERFVVKIGEHIKTVPTKEAIYFFSQEKATFLQSIHEKRFIIDYTLEQVEQLVDPTRYFRINRKYLVSVEAIKDIVTYSNSRLRIILKHNDEMDAIVSREKVQDFKKWLDR